MVGTKGRKDTVETKRSKPNFNNQPSPKKRGRVKVQTAFLIICESPRLLPEIYLDTSPNIFPVHFH